MLTKGQEQFARNIVEGMNQTAAYRAAYPKNKSADKSIWERASRLSSDPGVMARIQELRDKLAKASIMTAQERLEWLTEVVKDTDQNMTDRLRASDQMNKMQGEYITKVEAEVNNNISIKIRLTDD